MKNIKISVTLLEIEPKIERILLVPETLRLDLLHVVIQEAMGWQNYHLHSFETGERKWGIVDDEFPIEGQEPEDQATLAEFIAASDGSPLLYWYDFGDDWWHEIKVLETLAPKPGEASLKLLEVTGTCPPEDVGGVWGYEDFVEAMADPSREEHEDLKAWYGGDFHPQKPKTTAHKRAVTKLAKAWKLHKS